MNTSSIAGTLAHLDTNQPNLNVDQTSFKPSTPTNNLPTPASRPNPPHPLSSSNSTFTSSQNNKSEMMLVDSLPRSRNLSGAVTSHSHSHSYNITGSGGSQSQSHSTTTSASLNLSRYTNQSLNNSHHQNNVSGEPTNSSSGFVTASQDENSSLGSNPRTVNKSQSVHRQTNTQQGTLDRNPFSDHNSPGERTPTNNPPNFSEREDMNMVISSDSHTTPTPKHEIFESNAFNLVQHKHRAGGSSYGHSQMQSESTVLTYSSSTSGFNTIESESSNRDSSDGHMKNVNINQVSNNCKSDDRDLTKEKMCNQEQATHGQVHHYTNQVVDDLTPTSPSIGSQNLFYSQVVHGSSTNPFCSPNFEGADAEK